MRFLDDICKDYLLKLKLFNNYIRGKYNVIVVFDDRLCVVCMW